MWKRLKDASAAGERTARWRNFLLLFSVRLAVLFIFLNLPTVSLWS